MLHTRALDFAGGEGNTFGGAAGPSTAEGGNTTFGNVLSGGSGGFNPFASNGGGSAQIMQPINLIILGAVILGGVWLLKKK